MSKTIERLTLFDHRLISPPSPKIMESPFSLQTATVRELITAGKVSLTSEPGNLGLKVNLPGGRQRLLCLR